ncbi:MAG: ATP F0F1 synthase subunit B, partial [Rubrimonas sp.]
MPQLDFSQALPQILWLTLVFGLIYLAVSRLLPRVAGVVETRRQRIAADLGEAQAAREAADAASGGGQAALEGARTSAM